MSSDFLANFRALVFDVFPNHDRPKVRILNYMEDATFVDLSIDEVDEVIEMLRSVQNSAIRKIPMAQLIEDIGRFGFELKLENENGIYFVEAEPRPDELANAETVFTESKNLHNALVSAWRQCRKFSRLA